MGYVGWVEERNPTNSFFV